jgi:hypothetical protein
VLELYARLRPVHYDALLVSLSDRLQLPLGYLLPAGYLSVLGLQKLGLLLEAGYPELGPLKLLSGPQQLLW